MRNILLGLIMCISIAGFSQELNCNVVVNAQLTGNENLQIFKSLEKQLNEFVNNTKWTNKSFAPHEQINCSMVINVTGQNNDAFSASIQVQSARPVYGSTYTTPVYNINDKDFSFRYLEFQNIVYNPNQYESNLVSVIAFHVYMILGLDADTFEKNEGEEYFKQAQIIVNYSQQDNFKGWKLEDGLQSRFILVDNILSEMPKGYKTIFLLIVIDNFSHEEVSEMLNISKETSRSQLSRAKKWLQKYFVSDNNIKVDGIF